MSSKDATASTRTWIRRISIMLIVLSVIFVARSLPLNDLLQQLNDRIEDLGIWGPVVYALVYALVTISMIPASPLSIAAGALFGLATGTITVVAGATLGMAGAFLIARYLARSTVEKSLHKYPRFAAIDRAVGEKGWKIVGLLRLSPAVPFNLQNYFYGITAIRFLPCIAISSIAIIPGTFMYVYLGYAGRAGLSAAADGGAGRGMGQWIMLGVGLVATIIVTLYITRIAQQAMKNASIKDAGDIPVELPSESGESPTPSPLDALAPLDAHNRRLQAHVHPVDWHNPTPAGRYNMVVIGAGPAGLVTAAAVAGMGGKVALIERALMGGDCLNVGCVPSKALIRCGKAAAGIRDAEAFGVRTTGDAEVDFDAVMNRLRRLRADLSRHDSAKRFTALGIDVFLGEGRFSGRDTIEVGGAQLRFARALIATGARAAAPPIDGLKDIEYLTNETLFTLTELPKRLAIIGGGPIGCEMAQAFARLGSHVTLIEAGERILPRDDADAATIVEAALQRDGVQIVCGGKAVQVRQDGDEKILHLSCKGQDQELTVDHVLIAVGRAPNVEALDLASAGIEFDPRNGIDVNDYLQTSNPKVYAAGDVASRYKFTHAADAMARIVVRNALFFGRQKASALVIPWATYTDPEIAHVGLGADEASDRGEDVNTITVHFSEVDRAVLDGDEEGFVRLYLPKGKDTILGATIVGRNAGDMISEITTLMTGGKGLGTLANTIHPYPTQTEILKKAADAYNRTRLTPKVKQIFETLLRWRR
jgi:pyruvate/2-oxoglutarate dehydrogenase complex dihydrolipoamide dehydrogenase (E3) component/uncharacterized membrane protein YdjX (TVP38/TMEM64 family)